MAGVGQHLRHMANKAKTGISVEYRPRVILERPQLAALLGAVTAEWSRLDHDVTFLYANLMGGYLPTLEGFVPPLHPVALQAFDTLETQYHRLELLEKLAKWVVRDESLLSDLVDTVIPGIRSAAKLRNTLVHANWGIAGEYPDGLINNPIFGHNLVYKATDFDEAIERIASASKAARDFGLRYIKSREVQNAAQPARQPDAGENAAALRGKVGGRRRLPQAFRRIRQGSH